MTVIRRRNGERHLATETPITKYANERRSPKSRNIQTASARYYPAGISFIAQLKRARARLHAECLLGVPPRAHSSVTLAIM